MGSRKIPTIVLIQSLCEEDILTASPFLFDLVQLRPNHGVCNSEKDKQVHISHSHSSVLNWSLLCNHNMACHGSEEEGTTNRGSGM